MGRLEKVRLRRPSVLLLVDVKPASKGPRIIIPIPVAAITVLIETIGFWGPALRRLGVRLPDTISRHLEHAGAATKSLPVNLHSKDGESVVGLALRAVEELWRELISYGSWDLVNIKSSSGDRILIRFV